jgi:hypothetical protein
MASPRTSRFEFRSDSGGSLEGPLEWTRGQIVIHCAPGSLPNARVTRNDVPLSLSERVVDDSIRLVADWPLSGPGNYRLRLELSRSLVEESQWTVEPSKLSNSAFRTLLDDLEHRLPVSIAMSLSELGATTGSDLRAPVEGTSAAEEVARLRRTVMKGPDGPGLATILEEIAQDPHEVLADREIWVPAVGARRVTPVGLIRAASNGSNQWTDGLPGRLPDARAESSVDVYENRLLKSFVDQVEHRLRRLRRFLLSKNEVDLLADIESMEMAVRRGRLQASFLDSVGTLGQTPTRVTMVLVKKPPYRKLLELLLDFRRRARVRLEEPGLDSPLEKLPALYEKWGTLIAIQAVLDLGLEQGFVVTKHRLFGRALADAWIEVLSDGKSALELRHPGLGIQISVVPQRTFSRNASPFRSVSFQQVPDLTIEVEDLDGTKALYLLDPKYKLDSESGGAPMDGKPKKADIDKMHAYRDAIRDDEGNRVVRLAAILYPGQTKRFDDGLAALSAVPGAGGALSEEIKALLRPAFSD